MSGSCAGAARENIVKARPTANALIRLAARIGRTLLSKNMRPGPPKVGVIGRLLKILRPHCTALLPIRKDLSEVMQTYVTRCSFAQESDRGAGSKRLSGFSATMKVTVLYCSVSLV